MAEHDIYTSTMIMLNQSPASPLYRKCWHALKYLLAGLLLGAVLSAPAQNHAAKAGMLQAPENLFKEVQEKTSRMNERLLSSHLRYLRRMQATEQKIREKLARRDPALAAALFVEASGKRALLPDEFTAAKQTGAGMHTNYIAQLDTLQSALAFLARDGLSVNASAAQQALHSIGVLQHTFNQAEEAQKYIEDRKAFLQQQLGRYGFAKELKRYQKQAYYYQAQMRQYKTAFSDPSRLQEQAIGLLRKSARFRQFFQSHSQLAAMFRQPGDATAPPATSTALQSRDAVAQSLLQRFGSPVQLQQLLQGQGGEPGPGGLQEIKNRINAQGAGKEAAIPDFTPNTQKTKRFMNRLELGSGLQTVRANRFFPSTTDIALSAGYKLNDRSVAGLGGSYRMGWGRDIRHTSITHQGIGVRTYIDYKVKGCWITGGAEMNYRSRFNSFEILNNYSAWQKSALLGIVRKYQVSTKVKGNMQLLYDFLWKQQAPRTQALLFRIGYTLK